MKNIITVVGVILIVINITANLIFPTYTTFQMLLGNLSITLSAALVYVSYNLQTADGFKIGYNLLFIFSGLIRFICAITSEQGFKNSISAFLFVIIFSIEIFLVFVSYKMKGK